MNAKETCTAMSKKRGPQRSAQRQAAEKAGLSRAQMWRALQVAEIPADEFERLIESDAPPTVSELVRLSRNAEPEQAARRLRRCPHCGGDLTAILP